MPRRKSTAQIEIDAERTEKAASKLEKANARMASAQAHERELQESTDPENPEVPSMPEAEPSKLEKVLNEIGGEGSFVVLFIDGANESKMGQYDITEWPQKLEQLASLKGGGSFKVVFRNHAGHYCASTTRTFDSDVYRKKNGNGDHQQESGSVVRVMEMMQEQNREFRKDMEEMRNQQTSMLLKMVESMNGKGGIANSAQDIVLLSKLFKDDKPQKSFTSEMREFMEALAVFKEEAPGDHPIVSVVDRAFKLLRPVLEAGAARLNAPASVQGAGTPHSASAAPSLPSPTPSPTPVSSSQAAAPASALIESDRDKVLRVWAAHLLNAIAQGAGAHPTAQFVVANITEEKEADEMRGYAKDPGVIAKLCSINPALGAYHSWLSEFFAMMVAELDPSEGQVIDTEEGTPEKKETPEIAETKPETDKG